MKICPICGSKFSGSETFCPHDGARLYEAEQPAQLEGQELHHAVRLERLIFKDAFGERYFGEVTGTGDRVKVTVFNQAFKPKADRITSLASTKALLDTPMPAQISSTFAWDIESSPGYLLETAPRGASLRLLLDERGSLDWRVALKITCSLARSLEWMDNQGVVHRALQPEAIHITDIQKGYANLTEWALGVLAYQEDPLEALKKGNLIASAAYMAPELITSAGGADRKSSIYSLGLLLYEMLTGKSPFRAPDTEEMLKRQRREKPARLSTVYEGNDLPTELDDLFEVITHKLPEQRFQSLGALVNALSSMLDDGTSAADFPEPTRADDEPNIVIKPNGVRKKKKKKKPKKTLLFISADEIEKASQEQGAEASAASDAAAPSAPATAAPAKDAAGTDDVVEAKSADVDDASAATVKMKAEVLEEDKRPKKKKKPAPRKQEPVKEESGEADKKEDDNAEVEAKASSTEPSSSESKTEQGERAEDKPKDTDEAASSTSEVKGTSGTTDTEPPEKKAAAKPKRRKKKRAPKETVKLDTTQLEGSNKVSIDDPIETGDVDADPRDTRDDEGSSKVIVAEELSEAETESEATTKTSGESKTQDKPAAKKSTKTSKTRKSKATTGKSTTKDTDSEASEDKASEGDADKDATPSSTKSSKTKSSRSKTAKSKTTDKSPTPEAKKSSKASAKKSPAKTDEKKTKSTKKSSQPAASAASTDDNMEDIWFSTDTEAAWDREILMEHTARSEAKVRNYITLALITFIIAAALSTIYVVFIYEGDPDDEEASLHTDDAIEMMVASASPLEAPREPRA